VPRSWSSGRNSLVTVGLVTTLLVCVGFAWRVRTFDWMTRNLLGGEAGAAQSGGSKRTDPAASLDSFPPAEPISFPPIVDVDGVLRHPGQSDAGATTVFVFLATHCPICNAYLPELNRLQESFAAWNVEFYGVIVDGHTSAGEAANHRRTYHVDFPVLLDASGNFRRRLRPTHTPQAVVVDRRGMVVYCGRIDDRYEAVNRPRSLVAHRELTEVLREISAGRQPQFTRTKPVGCLIEPEDAEVTSQQLTFCRDIAPIVFANCVRCHREGESTPFALTSYEEVRDRAAQIASVVEQRIMPPWRARRGFGRFLNERCLSPDAIERITTWVRNGAPRGNPADLPPAPRFVAGWQLGKPDFVVTMPDEYEIPADGPDIYRNFVIPTELRQAVLSSAFEFRPGNPSVVHHAWVYFDPGRDARRLDAADPGPGYTNFGGPGFAGASSLGGWSPGGLPRRLPAGLGRPIPANSDLVLQIHYHPTGKRERDRSTIGFYFAPPAAQGQAGEIMVANYDLEIHAGARQQHVSGSHVLPVDTWLLDVTPHMHRLGRKMEVTAILPDHSVIPLIAIDDWSFSWQDHYVYREPIGLPAGTKLSLEAWYDNSSDNPQNPHVPTRDVYFGEKSDDEMCICFFQVTACGSAEMLMLENDMTLYIRDLMEQYRQGIARRSKSVARPERAGTTLGN
jgi:thiol-disulfide isomerase/thioredoxin